jgi:hypothetical protein
VKDRGAGSNVSTAVRSAIKNMLRDPKLRKKRIHTFKVIVFIRDEVKGATNVD